jgi:hypothetical protein
LKIKTSELNVTKQYLNLNCSSFQNELNFDVTDIAFPHKASHVLAGSETEMETAMYTVCLHIPSKISIPNQSTPWSRVLFEVLISHENPHLYGILEVITVLTSHC